MVCARRVSRFMQWQSCVNKLTCKPYGNKEKIKRLLTGSGSVRIRKNCYLGLENAALGLQPRTAFSRPRSQFSPYGPPSRPITYTYFSTRKALNHVGIRNNSFKLCLNMCLSTWAWSDFIFTIPQKTKTPKS